MDQLENNATFGFILSALLAIGNFLNGTSVSRIASKKLLTTIHLAKFIKNTYQLKNPLEH